MFLDDSLRAALAQEAMSIVTWLQEVQERFSGTPNGIELITFRIKSEESIEHKLQAFRRLTLEMIQDIIGCRAVCVNGLGARAVNREIEDRFGPRLTKPPTLRRTADGYLAWHTVMQSDQHGSGFRSEIQTRTLIQHAWARTSELLVYKRGAAGAALVADLKSLSRNLDEQDRQIERLFGQPER